MGGETGFASVPRLLVARLQFAVEHPSEEAPLNGPPVVVLHRRQHVDVGRAAGDAVTKPSLEFTMSTVVLALPRDYNGSDRARPQATRSAAVASSSDRDDTGGMSLNNLCAVVDEAVRAGPGARQQAVRRAGAYEAMDAQRTAPRRARS